MSPEERLMPLREAAKLFLGDCRHVATLRAEASRGNLVVCKIGRSYWTTLNALREMEVKCRVEAQAHGSGSTKSGEAGPSSTVDPAIAQGAALRTLSELKQHFGITSKESTNRPKMKRRSLPMS